MQSNYAYGPADEQRKSWAVFRLVRTPSGRIIKRKQLKTFTGDDARNEAIAHHHKLTKRYE